MSWYIMARAFVERKDYDGENNIEVLDHNIISSSPFAEEDDDFYILFDKNDIPADPGIYVVMCVALLHGVQDYWGDYDVEADILWNKIIRLQDDEAQQIISSFEK